MERTSMATRKEKELAAAEKSRQDSEMHRLYAAFLENGEISIEEAVEMLRNTKNQNYDENMTAENKAAENNAAGNKAVEEKEMACRGEGKLCRRLLVLIEMR